ncbi:MAG TPA: hypothetical protein VND21_09810 [Planctomycetota bacterium]|nr:hypothetical protein [Planctomycetota bacterium]
MKNTRRVRSLSRAAVAVAALVLLAGTAAADGGDAYWRDHPGAGVAAGFGVALLAMLGVAGLGAAVAVLGAVVPRLQATMDLRAREGGGLLSGSLVAVGALAAAAAVAQAGAVGRGAAALVVLAAAALALAGALATLPLLGERLLGARGAEASPLRRSVTGALALGLAFLPALALHLWPLAFLLGLVVVGWPLGVCLSGVMRRAGRERGAPAA